jgi:SAM-dependent methyltransferase
MVCHCRRTKLDRTQFRQQNVQPAILTLDELAAGNADAVRLSHVLEHLARPVPLLEKVRTILKPGGVLAVLVPHCESLDCVLKNLLLKCVPGRQDFRTSITCHSTCSVSAPPR